MVRINKLALISALALAIALPGAAQSVAEAGEFSVTLPSECTNPARQAQTAETPNGPIEVVMWVAKSPNGICIVNYSELSGPILEPDAQIDESRDNLMQQLGTRVQNERPLEITSFPGRRIEFEGQAGSRTLFGQTHFAVAHDRLYQFTFIGYSLNDRAAVQSSRYFSSISIEAPDVDEQATSATEDTPSEEGAEPESTSQS